MGKTPVFHHWRREAIPQPSQTSMGRLIIERMETCRGLCGPARPRGSYPRPPTERSHPASPCPGSIPELCRTSSSSACPASLGQQGRGEDWAAAPRGGHQDSHSGRPRRSLAQREWAEIGECPSLSTGDELREEGIKEASSWHQGDE